MAVEDDADLAAFFDADEFGEPAVYTPAVGSPPLPLTVLFSERTPVGHLNRIHRPETTDKDPVARVRIADFAAAGIVPEDGSRLVLTRSGRAFVVRRAPRDKSGVLYEIELTEAS